MIEHDAYYRDQSHLPPDERAKINYDHPTSLETDAARRAPPRRCATGEAVDVPIYDFTTHTRRSRDAPRSSPRA